MEAEFYGIQKIVDHIDFLESEKKQCDSIGTKNLFPPQFMQMIAIAHIDFPILGEVGCYVDDLNKNAFMFGNPDKLILVSGEQAFTQAMVHWRQETLDCIA